MEVSFERYKNNGIKDIKIMEVSFERYKNNGSVL